MRPGAGRAQAAAGPRTARRRARATPPKEWNRPVLALPLPSPTSVRTGQAPEQISAAARESDADLIAMTTHGRTGLRRLLFGSVAEAVPRTSHVPVFVLRAAQVEAVRRVA
jgi:nucleotide-binding universal stress UspA family protein